MRSVRLPGKHGGSTAWYFPLRKGRPIPRGGCLHLSTPTFSRIVRSNRHTFCHTSGGCASHGLEQRSRNPLPGLGFRPERETGIEPAAFSLGGRRSTTELLPHGASLKLPQSR